MILGSLLLAQAATTAKFIEIANTDFPEVRATAIVRLPALTAHERSLLHRLVAILPSGPPEYSRSDIFNITGGRVLRVQVMPDHLSIEVPAYKQDLAGAVSVLAETLRNARVDSPTQDSAMPDQDAWAGLLHGPFDAPDSEKLEPGELQEFYHRLVRPENVTVAIAGPFAEGAARGLWDSKTSDWKVSKFLTPWPEGDPLPQPESAVGGLELDGPEIKADSENLGSTVLALFALGCGKGASLFRIAREKEGLSYRQEAILWPTLNGFQPRLILAASRIVQPDQVGRNLKKDLIEDVASWTEDDRSRALGIADSVLLRGGVMSPFYFMPDRPVNGSLTDRAFLQAYWTMKSGQAIDPNAFDSQLHQVSLESLKTAAKGILSFGDVIIRKGRG